MGVYIKGMEMPASCNECRFAVDGWCYAYGKPNIDALANDGITNFCPLIPVPEHGRLIDADALEVVVEAHYKHHKISRYDRDLLLHYLDIEMSPTIIEAEEAEI